MVVYIVLHRQSAIASPSIVVNNGFVLANTREILVSIPVSEDTFSEERYCPQYSEF